MTLPRRNFFRTQSDSSSMSKQNKAKFEIQQVHAEFQGINASFHNEYVLISK